MGAPAQGSAPLFASGTRQRPPSPACRRSPGRGEARRCSAHSCWAMKRIWRFLWGRRAQGGPVSSGSSGGNELRPEGRDELCREATTSDLSPVQPLVKQCDSKCQDRDDR